MAAEIIGLNHFASLCSFLLSDTDYPPSALAVENVGFDTFFATTQLRPQKNP